MKHKTTLLALGVAGAFACSAASATTFLCAQDESDVSFNSCVEITNEALASRPTIEFVPTLEPAFVTYYAIEPADELATVELWVVPQPELALYSIEPAADDIASADLWLYSEPMVVTYFYTFDSALEQSGDAD